MKRLKAMSNREWVQKHDPIRIRETFLGGVYQCPKHCELEIYNNKCVNGCYLVNKKDCTECWDLPAKRNGKYIMKVVQE